MAEAGHDQAPEQPWSVPLAPGGFGAPGQPPTDRLAAWQWLLCAAGGFLLASAVGALLAPLAAALAHQSAHLVAIERSSVPPEWYVGVTLVSVWVGFVVGPVVASRWRGSGAVWADLGLRWRRIDLVGIPIGIAAQGVISVVTHLLASHLRNFGAPTTKLVGASHGWGFAVIAVMTVVGAPVAEELFFRGLLLRALTRLTAGEGTMSLAGLGRLVRLGVAVVLDGLLFGLAHAELEQLAFLAAFGVVLALLALRTNRLGMNIVTHASFNLVAVLSVVHARGGAIW